MKILKSDLNQPRVIGKDDWMFLRDDVPDYRRTNLFSEEELNRISYNLNMLEKYFRQKNILFAFLVAPNKGSIYPEYMPDYMNKLSPQNRLDQLILFINSQKPGLVIDVRNELMRYKTKGYQIYYPWGTHWTALGAYIGWNEIKKAMGNKKSDVIWVDSKVEIASRFITKHEEDGWIHYGWPHDQSFKIPNIIYSKQKEFDKDSFPRKKVKLIIAGDSFAQDYMGGMSNAFVDEYRFVPYHTNPEEILSFNPDIVILELAERYLDFLLSLKLPDTIIAEIVETENIVSPRQK